MANLEVKAAMKLFLSFLLQK